MSDMYIEYGLCVCVWRAGCMRRNGECKRVAEVLTVLMAPPMLQQTQ